MPRIKEHARYNVISMRISEEERREIENLMKKNHMSVSHIMREAIGFFAAHHEQTRQACLGA